MMKIFSFVRSSLTMQNWRKINMKRFHKSSAHFSVFFVDWTTNKVCLLLRHLVFTSCLTNDIINILINYGKYLCSSRSSCPRELRVVFAVAERIWWITLEVNSIVSQHMCFKKMRQGKSGSKEIPSSCLPVSKPSLFFPLHASNSVHVALTVESKKTIKTSIHSPEYKTGEIDNKIF